MLVYIAGPLFNEPERQRNLEIQKLVSSLGFDTYLPQTDCGLGFEEIKKGGDAKSIRASIFETDIAMVKKADILLCLLDGRVPDEGTCIELGLAYGFGKKCVGLKTDVRQMDVFGDNIMVEGCLSKLCRSEQELKTHLLKLKNDT